MLAKIGKRWWLPFVCAFAVAFLGFLSAAYVNYNSEPMYVGRTTVMESFGSPMEGQPDHYKMRLGDLGNLATSQAVLSNTAQTLSDLGMKFTPQQVLSGTSIMPVKDTNILAIEVTLPDAKEAKVAADVIAAEFKKVYANLKDAPLSQNREFIEAQIRRTREAMIQAQGALDRYKQENGGKLPAKKANMAALAIDLKSATDTYSLMRSKLDEAKIREQQSRTEVALKTIDPAYVCLVDQHHSLKLGIGLIGGFFAGIVLGLVLAALLPVRRQSEPISQQGV
jgi:uncharacterized protein involved in exopolysaccharide biosynthesis